MHPKLSVFVTGSDDKTVRLWNAAEHRLLCAAQLEQDIRSAAIAPDGSAVAVGLKNGAFAVLALKDLKQVMRGTLHFDCHRRSCRAFRAARRSCTSSSTLPTAHTWLSAPTTTLWTSTT